MLAQLAGLLAGGIVWSICFWSIGTAEGGLAGILRGVGYVGGVIVYAAVSVYLEMRSPRRRSTHHRLRRQVSVYLEMRSPRKERT
jgi:hypothetical protein